ncbi:hypothetical protein PVK74_30565 [Micromonospora chalcea]|uniref:hypothetical protein n=1 Tax=Micromonospora chalcea TaxID=1874 RepID=UPI002378CA1A|nr:hypothetical protein [Micromonospora chalcea]WDQ00114.1 hypothetical protein PVK74_30565 [Micromonospora chalcea]
MPDPADERALVFTIIAKQLDILGELVTTGNDTPTAGLASHLEGLKQAVGQTVFNIQSTGVTISNHSQHEGIKVTGDIFSNIGAGATIINRSVLSNSMNRLHEKGQSDIAEALRSVAEFIEKSGNGEAAENFGAMTEELDQPEPRKAILKTLWVGTLAALPAISELADAADKINGLFS